MKKRTGILLVVLVVVAAAALIAYRLYEERTPDVVSKNPDFTTEITTLLAAFEKDSASASGLYVGKIGQISGNVKSLDTAGAVVMGEEGSASEVIVGFDTRHMAELRSIRPGSTARLQGVCSGFDKSSADPDDLLSGLGTTVQFRSAGLVETK